MYVHNVYGPVSAGQRVIVGSCAHESMATSFGVLSNLLCKLFNLCLTHQATTTLKVLYITLVHT